MAGPSKEQKSKNRHPATTQEIVFYEHFESRRCYSVWWGTQKGHSQAPCQWCHLGILSTFTQDFKEPPYVNAKSLGVGWNSCLMISLSRGVGEAKDPSYTRSHFKSKLPGSPGDKRQIRHPIPPPKFLFLWLWAGVVWADNAAFLLSSYTMLQKKEKTTKFLRWYGRSALTLPAEICLTVFLCTPYHPCIFSDLPWALLQMGVLLYMQGPNTADMQNEQVLIHSVFTHHSVLK